MEVVIPALLKVQIPGALGVTIGIAEIAGLSFISPEGCVWPQFCLSSLECGIHGAPG